MVILNESMNRLRDLFTNDTNLMWLGTGTAPEDITNTGLQNGVAITRKVISKTLNDKMVRFDYSLESTTAIGTAFSEAGLQANGTAIDVNRVTYFPLIHEQTEEFNFSTIIFFIQGD